MLYVIIALLVVVLIFLYDIKSTLIYKNSLIEKQNKLIEYAYYPIVRFKEIENSIELSQHLNKQIYKNDSLDLDEEMSYFPRSGGGMVGSKEYFMNWRDAEIHNYKKGLEINLMAKNGMSFDELKKEVQKTAGVYLQIMK